MIDPKVFDQVAQLSHVGWAMLVIMTPYALGCSLADTLSILPIWIGLAAWKEFYWDSQHEAPDVRGSGLRDFLFYCLGLTIASIALLLRWKAFA